jgi:hypothetical protein
MKVVMTTSAYSAPSPDGGRLHVAIGESVDIDEAEAMRLCELGVARRVESVGAASEPVAIEAPAAPKAKTKA